MSSCLAAVPDTSGSWRARASRLLAATVAMLALLASLAACHAVTPWRGIIKVAIVAPYSGPVTSPGESLLVGARLAESEINAAGGVDGYRILLSAPDERQPSTPAAVVADPAVLAVIGDLLPDAADAAAIYQRAGLVWLAAEPVAPGNEVYPMVAPVDSYYSALDRYLSANGASSGRTGADPATACRQAAGQGDGAVAFGEVEAFCGGQADDLAATLADPSAGGSAICVAAWCKAPEVAAWASGRPYDYVAPVAAPADSASWRAFVAATGSAAPVETDAAIGYDGVRLVAAALDRAIARGEVSRQAIAEQMRATRYRGLLGDYDGRGTRAPVVEVRREAGAFPGQLLFQVEDQP